MRRKTMRHGFLLCSMLLVLAGCEEKGPTAEELYAVNQESYQMEPLTPAASQMIDESRGDVLYNEKGEIVKVEQDTWNPGEEREVIYGALTKEQLMDLDTASQLSIFVNGIVREEYRVAANTLYGVERANALREEFRTALGSQTGEEGENTVVDYVGVFTQMKDTNVANQFVDTILQQFNRTFVLTNVQNNFEGRVTVQGVTFSISLIKGMENLILEANNFTKLSDNYLRQPTEEDQKSLHKYYLDTFEGALINSPLQKDAGTRTIGGFELGEDGLWVPSDMQKLAKNLYILCFLS